MPLPVVAGLIAVLGAAFAKLLTVDVAKFIAMKILLLAIFTLVLPVVLYNLIGKVMLEIMQYASSSISSGGTTEAIVQLSGMGAWICNAINLQATMAIIMSAIATRFVLTMIGR